jgi:hypothetical protein
MKLRTLTRLSMKQREASKWTPERKRPFEDLRVDGPLNGTSTCSASDDAPSLPESPSATHLSSLLVCADGSDRVGPFRNRARRQLLQANLCGRPQCGRVLHHSGSRIARESSCSRPAQFTARTPSLRLSDELFALSPMVPEWSPTRTYAKSSPFLGLLTR